MACATAKAAKIASSTARTTSPSIEPSRHVGPSTRGTGSAAASRSRPAAARDPAATYTTSSTSWPTSRWRLKKDANTGSAAASNPASRTAIGAAMSRPAKKRGYEAEPRAYARQWLNRKARSRRAVEERVKRSGPCFGNPHVQQRSAKRERCGEGEQRERHREARPEQPGAGPHRQPGGEHNRRARQQPRLEREQPAGEP